jgi:hypothetical protein
MYNDLICKYNFSLGLMLSIFARDMGFVSGSSSLPCEDEYCLTYFMSVAGYLFGFFCPLILTVGLSVYEIRIEG